MSTPSDLVPLVFPSAYLVSLLPPDHPRYTVAAVTVRLDPQSGLWSVDRLGHLLDAHGCWEPAGPRRSAAWWADRRWPLVEARRRAEEAAPRVVLGERTVADLCRALREAG